MPPGRGELASKERAEPTVLAHYLPSQLTDAEVDALADQAITKVARTRRDAGAKADGPGHEGGHRRGGRPGGRDPGSPRQSRPAYSADALAPSRRRPRFSAAWGLAGLGGRAGPADGAVGPPWPNAIGAVQARAVPPRFRSSPPGGGGGGGTWPVLTCKVTTSPAARCRVGLADHLALRRPVVHLLDAGLPPGLGSAAGARHRRPCRSPSGTREAARPRVASSAGGGSGMTG